MWYSIWYLRQKLPKDSPWVRITGQKYSFRYWQGTRIKMSKISRALLAIAGAIEGFAAGLDGNRAWKK